MVDVDTMEDTEVLEAADTEVSPVDAEPEGRSIRDALKDNFSGEPEAANAEATPEVPAPIAEQQAATPRTAMVAPADMNRAEKEAYLAPTLQNQHVIQEYLNRRAYETRNFINAKSKEFADERREIDEVTSTLKRYEDDYARQGISLAQVAKRSVAWDQAMQVDPLGTAIEWLDSYGLSLSDFQNGNAQSAPQQQQSPQEYLTRAEAESIADERWASLQESQQQNSVAYYNERTVESFVDNKPLFKDPETAAQLEAEMAPIVAALVSTGRYNSPDEILETAYNYVVQGSPTFSNVANAINARSRAEQNAASVQRAKSASRSITGSTGSGTPRLHTKDLRDNLRLRFGSE